MLLKCLVYTDMVCLDLNSSQNWIYNYYGKMPVIGKKFIFKLCCGTCIINSFLASSHFRCLLITFANSLNPDQDRQNVSAWSGSKQTVNTHHLIINGHHFKMNIWGPDITLQLLGMQSAKQHFIWVSSVSSPLVSSLVVTSDYRTSPDINRTNKGHVAYGLHTKHLRNA